PALVDPRLLPRRRAPSPPPSPAAPPVHAPTASAIYTLSLHDALPIFPMSTAANGLAAHRHSAARPKLVSASLRRPASIPPYSASMATPARATDAVHPSSSIRNTVTAMAAAAPARRPATRYTAQ